MRGDVTESFGKYELIERIGKGGMAEVFLARSVGAEGIEKTLVIKRILPKLASDSRFVEMFISEAKIAMGLNHPNIVQIYDFGKVGDDYYLAMEYVDGVELGRLMKASKQVGEPLVVGDAVYLAMEVARGLDYAHRREDALGRNLGLVHCDISPENLMITWDGTVKIVDFGIARVSSVGSNKVGELKGKYRYMSPEQAAGDTIDQRSDLFSLGVVLFEMVCRRPLFRGESTRETLSMVLSAVVPDVRSINSNVPEPLEHSIYKALARQPEERYETAREMQGELTRVLYGLSEIHDTTTVSEHLATVENKLPSDSREMMASALEQVGGDQETMVTRPGITPRHELTPMARTDWEGKTRQRQTATQRKEVILLAGRIIGLDTREVGTAGDLLDDEYRRIIDSIAYKNNGVIHHIDASGFVLLLGIPVSDEGDAERAARMAFDVEDAISEMVSGADSLLQCRLSITVGEVILEEVAVAGERHYEWTLEESAEAGLEQMLANCTADEICVDEQVHGRIQRTFYCEAIDDRLDEDDGDEASTARAYRLIRPKSARSQILELRESFHSFFGREIPSRILRDTFRQVLFDERARALLVLGPSGVGKSTLIEEFLSGLPADEVRVVRGVASPFNRDVPLASAEALFSQMLRFDIEGSDEEIRQDLTDRLDTVFAAGPSRERDLVEESLFRLFSVTEDDDGFSPLSGVERRQKLMVTLRTITNRFGDDRPLVLAIDDVHHIDPVMMTFAAEYFDQTQKAPVFFVGTGLDSGPHTTTRAWRELIEARHLEVESLGELARPEAEQMVRELLAHHGVDSDAFVDEVLQRSGGNPLHIKEVVEALSDKEIFEEESGLIALATSENLLPASVEGLVRARMDRLETADQDTVRRLSLLPSPFSIEEARAVIDGRCGSLLEQMVDEGLLRRHARNESQANYRFVNTVTREVARRSLVAEEAQSLHRRIADHMLSRRDQYDSAVIARHLEAAGAPGEALQFYEEAVERAFREFGADQCLQLCDRMLASPEIGDERRFRVLKWRETALRSVGDTDSARESLRELEALAPQVGDTDDQIEIAIRRARFFITEGEFDDARDAVKVANKLAGDAGDRLGKADAWRVEAIIELNEGRRDRALTLIDRAIASLNVGGDHRSRKTMVEAYNVRGVILRQSGRHYEALEAYETALAAASGLESTTLMRQLLINSGLALAYTGEFAEARRRYRRALDACDRLGHRRDEALVWVNLGDVYQMLGRFDRAIQCCRRGIYLARQTNSAMTVADGQVTLGLTYMGRGDLERAHAVLTEGLSAAEEMPSVYLAVCAELGLAQVALAGGKDEAIEQAMQRTQSVLERSKEAGMMWSIVMGHELLAQSLRHLGEVDQALKHSRKAVEMLDEVDLLGVDQVLVTHAELLADRPEEAAMRRQCIERAVAVFQSRHDGLDSEDQELFVEQPLNQKILKMSRVLDAEEEAPTT